MPVLKFSSDIRFALSKPLPCSPPHPFSASSPNTHRSRETMDVSHALRVYTRQNKVTVYEWICQDPSNGKEQGQKHNIVE